MLHFSKFNQFIVGLIILFSLQNCTAWPALTALLALTGEDKGGGFFFLPPGGGSTAGGGGGGDGNNGQTPIDTNPNNPSSDLSSNATGAQIFYEGVAISPIIITGDNLISCSIDPALPPDLEWDTDTCTISGTPAIGSAIPTTNYTITGNFPDSRTSTIVVSLAIQPGVATLTADDAGPHIYWVDVGIDSVVFTSTGGIIATNGCSIQGTPSSLPTGLTLIRTNDTTCTLSGTPQETATIQTYTVRAENPAGFTTATVQFEVRGPPTGVSFTSPGSPLTAGEAITPIVPTSLTGGQPTSCSVSPALPTGLSINPTTCVISGTPNAGLIINPAQEYTITASNPAGNTSGTISLSVFPQAPNNLTFINPGSAFTENVAITPILPNTLGGGTPTNCSITSTSPTTDPVNSLPTGLSINPTTCQISGIPTETRASVTYTITASNLGGTTNGTVTFTVNPAPPQNLNYAGSPYTFTQGVAITPIVPTVDGVISNCLADASTPLPHGISLDPTNCAISGTPTSSTASASYTIIPSNASGNGDTASITFTIEPFPTVTSVTSPAANGAYREGQIIPIHVVFNRNVTVTGAGTPIIALSTGTPAITYINYTSGSGSNTLIFTYTVAPGNNSPDLSYVNASSLDLNGAFIRDSQSNDANLTLPIPGQPNSLSANKNLVIDTIPPVISGVSPASNVSVNNTAVSYTISETCASGFTRWTQVGGTADPGSPHTANWTGSELNSGTRTNTILGQNPTLVDNAIYDISFHCTDPAGNIADSISSTSVTFSSGPLQVVSAETLDTNNNGKIDTYRIAFNKPVNDSTFPGYIANSLGDITSQWLIAGYSGVRLLHGSAVAFAVDTPNDAILYLRFNENPLECSASTTVGCDTAAKPDITTTATTGLQDLASNGLPPLNTTSIVEMDGARPILVGARSLGAALVDALFSEPVNLTDSEFIPNYSITPEITVLAADRSTVNMNVVRLSTTNQTGGTEYTLDVATAVRDLANLNMNTNINPNNNLPGNQTIFTGLVAPVVESIVTTSATTLRITFNELIVASTAECSTQSGCALIYQNVALPVLSAVSEAGAGVNSVTFILTVNPMIQGQPYTTIVLQNTVQSVASNERMSNTNNSATFNGDGKPNANISSDTAMACPTFNTSNGVARRVIIQYDQSVISNGSANAANNPSNYSIIGCTSGGCTTGTPQTSASSVSDLSANRFAVDFSEPFNTANQIYQLRIQNVQDATGNTIPLPGTLTFQCGDDNTPPSLLNVTVVSSTNAATVLILNFSESVDNITANISTNYRYSGNAYGFMVDSAVRQTNQSQVRLTFAPGLPNGGHQLRVRSVQDLAGNVILDNGVNNVQPFILNAPTGFGGGSVFDDPFNDGTPAANVVIYDGKLYVGADQSSSKLFETNFSLTTAQTITLDADGNLFNGVNASFAGYLTKFTGCSNTFLGNPPSVGQMCNPRQPVEGVDTIFSGCVGGTSTPEMTGIDCGNAGGKEYLFIGALRSVVNQAFTRSFFFTNMKSSNNTIFPFEEAFTGDAGGGVAFRSMNIMLFKDNIFSNVGAEGGGGGRGGRVCMNDSGCSTGQTFLENVNLDGWQRMKRIGVSGTNLLRNGSYNGAGAPYADPNTGNLVLNAVSTMYEYDNDGPGGNESQLYIANGGFYVNNLPTSSPWERIGTSDGGIMRTRLSHSSRNSLPGNCPNNSSGCLDFWEDVTPDNQEKWSRYLSIPWPQNSAITATSSMTPAQRAVVCSTSWIEMDCTEPFNLFVPALKAIPYMRSASNGDLYLIRNACSTKNICTNGNATCNFRTEKQVCPKGQEIPQLWRMSKNCGSATNCTNDWRLVAERGSTGRTDMGNVNNSHITLLEVVGSYLYIGFDNSINGANIWRVNMASIASGSIMSQADFSQVNVNGIGPDSGGSNQKLFSHVVVNNDGKNWLIITTRDGLGAARIYRTANDEN